MATCSYCRARIAETAAYCPACGQESPGYGRYLSGDRRPTTPEFWERTHRLGRPAVRVLAAVLGALVASTPLYLLFPDEAYAWLVGDLLLAVVVIACAWPQRDEMAALLRAPALAWTLVAVAGAAVLPAVAEVYLGVLGALFGIDLEGPGFLDHPTWIVVVSICLFPAVFEELAFRGLVLGSLFLVLRPVAAHLLTAVLFAAVHFSPLVFPYHLLVGLFLGWLRTRTGTLTAPMLAHAVHNAAVVFLWTG